MNIYFWDIHLLLYFIFIVAPLSIILHEFGHAFAARTLQADHIIVSIGKGNILKTIGFKKIKIIIHAFFFLGGLAESNRKIPYKSPEIIFISIFGPIFNGIIVLLFYILSEMYPNNYFQLFFWFNIWLAVINLIPFKIGERQTDGYAIVKVFLRKKGDKV